MEDHSDVYSAYLNDDGTLKGVDSAALVTLPQYKGISVPAEEYTITDDELNTQINSILDQYAAPKPFAVETAAKLREMGVKIGSTTGYTDAMMNIVAPKAAQQGYAPDFWISPDGVGGRGRPYPYMIFANMQALGLTAVGNVVKVGDTISDIKEGVNAGVWTAGVIEGSSELGLSQQEYEAMSPQERETACQKVEERFRRAGAHFVVRDLSQLPDLVHACGFKNMRR